MSEQSALYVPIVPGPREYRLALVDGLGPLLPREEATFTTLPERTDAACLSPDAVATRLRALAEFARAAREDNGVTRAGAFGVLADALEELAWKVIPA